MVERMQQIPSCLAALPHCYCASCPANNQSQIERHVLYSINGKQVRLPQLEDIKVLVLSTQDLLNCMYVNL